MFPLPVASWGMEKERENCDGISFIVFVATFQFFFGYESELDFLWGNCIQ